MEILPPNSTCLDLSIAMPGFSSSRPSFPPSVAESDAIKIVNINEAPSRSELEEYCMEEEEEEEEDSRNRSGPGSDPGPAPRKKLRLTIEQSRRLEQSFIQHQALSPKEKEILAVELRLKARQVEVWFQNRRARSKMKQTEIECSYLKRWVGALTEQNRRLQREVEELRFMNMKAAPPPTSAPQFLATLTMCPRCEHASLLIDKGGRAAGTTTTAPNLPFLRRRPTPTSIQHK